MTLGVVEWCLVLVAISIVNYVQLNESEENICCGNYNVVFCNVVGYGVLCCLQS